MGKRRKKKIFESPEDRAAWEARTHETQRQLDYYIERIKRELAAKEKPA
jgi:hypothetical protein